MEQQEKLYFYKYGSIILAIIDLWMLIKCAFFEISEKFAFYLQLSKNSIPCGKITLFQFQKLQVTLVDYFTYYSDEYRKDYYYMAQMLYWIIVIFIVAGIIEIILHLFNSKAIGYWFLTELFVCVIVFYFWAMTPGAFEEDFGVSVISFTPCVIGIVAIPLVSSAFWIKYNSILDKINVNNSKIEINDV